MKKIVLYCLACILLSACVREDNDDCLSEVRFIVTYEHSVEKFDSKVANEVYFHVYQNDMLVKTDILPYEAIKGGKEYVVKDYTPGTYRIAAWAVPASEDDVCEIPDVLIGDRYEEQSLALNRRVGSTKYYDPIGTIFLGEKTVVLRENEDSLYEISLEPCICNVWFTVYNPEFLILPVKNKISGFIELEGTRSEMLLDRSCGGEESIIYKSLVYDPSDDTLISGRMGVLPSDEDDYLSVTLYNEQGEKVCLVETDYQAEPGDDVYIYVYAQGGSSPQSSVNVSVNGWRVKNAFITYF